jgi:hypothetical protein
MGLGISEASPIFILGGSATAFPHVKYQHKKAYFRGKWQALAGLKGKVQRKLRGTHFIKKVTDSKGFETKTIMRTPRESCFFLNKYEQRRIVCN